jgi:hypothetical protein
MTELLWWTPKRIEHDLSGLGHVADGISDQCHRLDRGMGGKVRHPPLPECVHAGIIPDIGPVAAILAKLDVVGVRSSAFLRNQDQFMLGAIERAHSAVGLVPNTHVKQGIL